MPLRAYDAKQFGRQSGRATVRELLLIPARLVSDIYFDDTQQVRGVEVQPGKQWVQFRFMAGTASLTQSATRNGGVEEVRQALSFSFASLNPTARLAVQRLAEHYSLHGLVKDANNRWHYLGISYLPQRRVWVSEHLRTASRTANSGESYDSPSQYVTTLECVSAFDAPFLHPSFDFAALDIRPPSADVIAQDERAPRAIAYTPTPGFRAVSVSPTGLTIEFDEPVRPSAGAVFELRRYSDDSLIQSLPLSSATFSGGNQLITFPVTASLAYETAYYVEAAAGSVEDFSGNDWAGLLKAANDSSPWYFETVSPPDLTGPTVQSLSPATGSTVMDLAPPPDFEIVWDERVMPGAGRIEIIDTATGNIIARISTADRRVSYQGLSVFLYIDDLLTPGENYDIRWPAGAFTDQSFNDSGASPPWNLDIDPNALIEFATNLSITGSNWGTNTLTANYTLASGYTGSVVWQRWDGASWVQVGTGQTYTLTAADEGESIRFQVTTLDPQGNPQAGSEVNSPTATILEKAFEFETESIAVNAKFIPRVASGVDATVDWGDGTVSTFTGNGSQYTLLSHDYSATSGPKTVGLYLTDVDGLTGLDIFASQIEHAGSSLDLSACNGLIRLDLQGVFQDDNSSFVDLTLPSHTKAWEYFVLFQFGGTEVDLRPMQNATANAILRVTYSGTITTVHTGPIGSGTFSVLRFDWLQAVTDLDISPYVLNNATVNLSRTDSLLNLTTASSGGGSITDLNFFQMLSVTGTIDWRGYDISGQIRGAQTNADHILFGTQAGTINRFEVYNCANLLAADHSGLNVEGHYFISNCDQVTAASYSPPTFVGPLNLYRIDGNAQIGQTNFVGMTFANNALIEFHQNNLSTADMDAMISQLATLASSQAAATGWQIKADGNNAVPTGSSTNADIQTIEAQGHTIIYNYDVINLSISNNRFGLETLTASYDIPTFASGVVEWQQWDGSTWNLLGTGDTFTLSFAQAGETIRIRARGNNGGTLSGWYDMAGVAVDTEIFSWDTQGTGNVLSRLRVDAGKNWYVDWNGVATQSYTAAGGYQAYSHDFGGATGIKTVRIYASSATVINGATFRYHESFHVGGLNLTAFTNLQYFEAVSNNGFVSGEGFNSIELATTAIVANLKIEYQQDLDDLDLSNCPSLGGIMVLRLADTARLTLPATAAGFTTCYIYGGAYDSSGNPQNIDLSGWTANDCDFRINAAGISELTNMSGKAKITILHVMADLQTATFQADTMRNSLSILECDALTSFTIGNQPDEFAYVRIAGNDVLTNLPLSWLSNLSNSAILEIHSNPILTSGSYPTQSSGAISQMNMYSSPIGYDTAFAGLTFANSPQILFYQNGYNQADTEAFFNDLAFNVNGGNGIGTGTGNISGGGSNAAVSGGTSHPAITQLVNDGHTVAYN